MFFKNHFKNWDVLVLFRPNNEKYKKNLGHFDRFWSYSGGKKSEMFWDFLIYRLVRFEDFNLATLELTTNINLVGDSPKSFNFQVGKIIFSVLFP